APRFIDGLAYDLYPNEWVAFEGPSSEYKANVNKMVDNNANQVRTTMVMLKNIINRLKSLFDKDFGTQSARSSIVSAEEQFKEDGRFIYREVYSVEVPIAYKERTK
ncbi:hypothetical protein BD408DRAFT_352279, partial [Parasitella parasitica]